MKTDLFEKTAKIYSIFYFISILYPTYAYLFIYIESNLLIDISNIIPLWIGFFGIVGFAWKKKIGTKLFWKLFFIYFLTVEVLMLSFFRIFIHQNYSIMNSFNDFILFIPALFFIYFYIDNKNIWNTKNYMDQSTLKN